MAMLRVRAQLRQRLERQGGGLLLSNLSGQQGDGGRLKQGAQGQLDVEGIGDFGHQGGGDQGVSAKLEKVVLYPYLFDSQKVLPNVSKNLLGVIARSNQGTI